MVKTIVVKKIHETSQDDARYWYDKTPQERIDALEQLRQEYHQWKYKDAQPRFQRVYRVTKRS